MERRDNGKINFREIARSLDISVMTLYRVVNNEPNVRRETRAKIVDALNRHGYYTHSPRKNIRILFDFTDHEYLTYYGNMLRENISKLNYTCYSTDHRKRPGEFFDRAGECEVAVFASIPDDEAIRTARRANPDIYTLNLSTLSSADVTLSPDNTRGSELAANHFFKLGHRHIAVHLSEKHPTRMERCKAFFAEMKTLDPDCRIDFIRETRYASTRNVLETYFRTVDRHPTGLFFLAGEFAELFRRDVLTEMPELANLGIMTFDNPLDLEFRKLYYNFDRIEFVSRDLLDWAEYYITNRPMMKKRSPIHTSIDVHLIVTGSVRATAKDSPGNRMESGKKSVF